MENEENENNLGNFPFKIENFPYANLQPYIYAQLWFIDKSNLKTENKVDDEWEASKKGKS